MCPDIASLSVYLEDALETGTEGWHGGPTVPFRQLYLILAGKQAATGIKNHSPPLGSPDFPQENYNTHLSRDQFFFASGSLADLPADLSPQAGALARAKPSLPR